MSSAGENTRSEQIEFQSAQKQWLNPRRILIIVLALASLTVGIIAFLVHPLYIIAVLVALVLAVLIFLYPFFGLLVYYVLLVVRPGAFAYQLAALHPERIIGGLLLVAVLIHKKYCGQKILLLGERLNWLFLFFIFAMLLSVPGSYWPTQTIWTVVNFLKICVFYFLIINVIETERQLRGFLWVYIISTGYSAISSAIAYFSGTLIVAQGIERAEGLAGSDPNTLAVNLILAIPFMLFSFSWIKNHWLRLVPIFCGACAVFTVALTGSRSGILGLVAVLFFVWLTSKRKLAYALVFITLLVVGWFSLPEQYQARYASITSTEYDPSTVGRFEAWGAGLRMFLERPFTGVGAGTFGVAYASGEYSERSSWLKAHSMYVQVLAEMGILGLVAFAALVYFVLRQNFRLRRKLRGWFEERHWLAYLSYAITCSLGALFVTSVFGHSLFRLHWYWAAALTVVMWRLADKLKHDDNEGKTTRDGLAG